MNGKKQQQGTLSQGNRNLQRPKTWLWWGSDKGVDLALTLPESKLPQRKIRRWLSPILGKILLNDIIVNRKAGFQVFVTFQEIDFPSHLSKYSNYCIFWKIALVLSLVTLKGELIFGQGTRLLLLLNLTNYFYFDYALRLAVIKGTLGGFYFFLWFPPGGSRTQVAGI